MVSHFLLIIIFHYDSLLLSAIVVIIVMFDFVNRYVLLQSLLTSLVSVRVTHEITDVTSRDVELVAS